MYEGTEIQDDSGFIDDSNIGFKRRCLIVDGFDRKKEHSPRHRTGPARHVRRRKTKKRSHLYDRNSVTDLQPLGYSFPPNRNNQMTVSIVSVSQEQVQLAQTGNSCGKIMNQSEGQIQNTGISVVSYCLNLLLVTLQDSTSSLTRAN